MHCVASKTRKEKFSGHDENCQKNVSDLEDSLVTSSTPSGQPQRRPDDGTSNTGVEAWAADGNRRTHKPLYYQPQGSMADHRCYRRAMSEVLMQQSVMYCGALCCRHRWTVAQSLYCTRSRTSSQCSSSCSRLVSLRESWVQSCYWILKHWLDSLHFVTLMAVICLNGIQTLVTPS